jgi:hypothetical protein
VDGLPPGGHPSDYNVSHPFGSPYIAAANPYDQWPSSVVPVPSTVTVNSVESSPGASGPGDDFTPTYGHTAVPVMDGGAMTSNTSAPGLNSSKLEYQELDAGMGSAGLEAHHGCIISFANRRWRSGPPTNSYPSQGVQQSSTYLPESPWPVYPTGTYYSQATAL